MMLHIDTYNKNIILNKNYIIKGFNMLLRDYLNVKYGIKKHNVFAHEIGKLPQTVNRWCMLGATIDEKGRIYSGSAQSRLLITIIRDKCPKH